ncbi:la-related protein 6 isoform X2 [Petromyzon marinus]|uniref:la-related protein 6 isoform X2 n=1 Tax=Petromyzon marinus TaxID=7757 RepID=UPI003F700089
MGREYRRSATRAHSSRRARVAVEADGGGGGVGGGVGGVVVGGGHAVSLPGLLMMVAVGVSRLLGWACAVVQRGARRLGGLLLVVFFLRGAEDDEAKKRKTRVRLRHRCVPSAAGPRDHVELSHGQQQRQQRRQQQRQQETADASSELGTAEEEEGVPQGPEDVVAMPRGSEEEVLVVVEDDDDAADDEVLQKLEEEMVRGMEAMPQSLEMIGVARGEEEEERVVVEEEEEEGVVVEEGVGGEGPVLNLSWFADLDPPEPEVERMLSDEALSRDPFMLKHVRRNGPGYVSVKLLTSLRGVRRLTRDWRVSSLALRASSRLQLNAAGTKVRRLDRLPTHLLAPPASPGAAALSGGDGDARQPPPPPPSPPDVCAAGLGSPGPRAGAAEGSGGGSGGRQSAATQCGLGDEGSACSELAGDGGAEGRQRAASGGALRLGGPGTGSRAVAVVLAEDAVSVGTQTPCDPSPVGRADFDYDAWVNERPWPCCDGGGGGYGGGYGYGDVCDCSDDSDDGGGGGGGGICEVMAYRPWVVRHRLAALRAARSGGAGAIGGGGSARPSSPRILRLPRGPDGTGGFAQHGAVAGHGQPAVATTPGSSIGEAAAIYLDGDRWDLSWGPGPSSSLH